MLFSSITIIFNFLEIEMSLLNDINAISTSVYDAYFQFTNTNIEIISYNPNSYVVFNQLKLLNFTLSDQENDELFIKIVDSGLLNIYIQRLPSNTEFQLAVMALDTTNSNQTVVLQYTDAYHQDPSSWKNLTISIVVYPTEPPRFASQLNDVMVSACDNFSIKLPEVVDDSESFWIELDPSTPSWITLIGNSSLTIDALDANLNKAQTVLLVTFKLRDDSGAVVHPQLKLLIDTSMLFMFNQFDDIKAVFYDKLEISVGTGVGKDIRLVYWTTGQLVEWSSYSPASSKIIINTTDPDSIGTHCIQAVAVDGWGKIVYSAQFNIDINVKSPPAILGEFESIKLMKGEKRVFIYR